MSDFNSIDMTESFRDNAITLGLRLRGDVLNAMAKAKSEHEWKELRDKYLKENPVDYSNVPEGSDMQRDFLNALDAIGLGLRKEKPATYADLKGRFGKPLQYVDNPMTLDQMARELGMTREETKQYVNDLFLESQRQLQEKTHNELEAKRVEEVNKAIDDDLNSPAGVISQLILPTATDEAVYQAKSGNYDDGRMYGSMILDGVTDVGSTVVPFSGIKYGGKVANFLKQPLEQAAWETARQGGQSVLGIGDNEFNVAPVFGSAVASATVPALKGTVQAYASHVPGAGKVISEGIESTNKFTPLHLEKETNEALYKRWNEIVDHIKAFHKSNGTPNLDNAVAADIKALRSGEIPNSLNSLYNKDFGGQMYSPKVHGMIENDKNAIRVGSAFDNADYINPTDVYEKAIAGDSKAVNETLARGWKEKQNKFIHTDGITGKLKTETTSSQVPGYQSDIEELKSVAPQLFNEAEGTKASELKKVGMWVGDKLDLVGSRVEPTIKFNPLNPKPTYDNSWYDAVEKDREKRKEQDKAANALFMLLK